MMGLLIAEPRAISLSVLVLMTCKHIAVVRMRLAHSLARATSYPIPAKALA